MPRFIYVAKDKNGRKYTAVIEAKDQESAVLKLQGQGFFLIQIIPETAEQKSHRKHATDKKFIQTTHNAIKLNDLVIFCRQLATMLGSGVTLLRSLDTILRQLSSKGLSKTLSRVKLDVERGSSFSNALAKHSNVFSPFWISLVEVGEASGNLPKVLDKMAEFLEEKADFQRKIISSILYPVVLVAICVLAILIFSFKIMPMFMGIYGSFGVKLPALTQLILSVFTFIRQKFLFIFIGVFAVIFLFRSYIKTSVGKKQFEDVAFRLPVAGDFLKAVVIERFVSQMSLLVDSGVPILYALEITQRVVDSTTMYEIVGDIKSSTKEGQLIADAMNKSGFFNPMVVQMVLIGEETGELGSMLSRVAGYYQSYIATVVERFTTLFEPIMLIFMGAVVGLIVISMYLPLFGIARLGG